MKEKNFYFPKVYLLTITFFILGELLVIFLSNSERGFTGNIVLGTFFVVLSSIIFLFLALQFFRQEPVKGTGEAKDDTKSKEDLYNLNKMLEAEKQFRKSAEIMNNAKSQFLSNMSQEIRIPMSGIIGMTELLTLTNLTKEQKEYLDIINFSSSTLLAIINDILDFSRIESGKLKLENIDFSIKELISKTAQILDFEARRKNLILKTEISDKIDYNICGDPLRLNQIIINLTKNAIKFTEQGEIKIKLNEIDRTKSNVKLSLEISDTGTGFDENVIQSLFGQLGENGRVKFSKSFEYNGVGFGLPIVSHIISLMNGELFIRRMERGTSVLMNIPFLLHEPIPEKTEEGQGTETKTEHKPHSKINILVAEDNLVNQRLVKELLVRKNYEVTIVENGLKIFELLEDIKFDMILMDIQMPIMDGLEATSIIREIEKGTGNHIPIIGITAYAVKADREKCLSVGMDDYMSKPFVKEEFYSMIEKYSMK